MNQRRNGLSNVNGKSESVKEKERMIWSEVGMLVGTLSLLDIIVRGLVLNCPFREWAGSLAVFFIIIVYYCIRAGASGNAHAENRHQRRTAKAGEAAADRFNCGHFCGSGAYDVRQGVSPYILCLAENDLSFYRLRRHSVSASVCHCEAVLQKSDKRNKKEIILTGGFFFCLKAGSLFN